MPEPYEKVRDSEYQRLIQKGINKKKALKIAKRIAAIWYWKQFRLPAKEEN